MPEHITQRRTAATFDHDGVRVIAVRWPCAGCRTRTTCALYAFVLHTEQFIYRATFGLMHKQHVETHTAHHIHGTVFCSDEYQQRTETEETKEKKEHRKK